MDAVYAAAEALGLTVEDAAERIEEDGFLTDTGRVVDREEALAIALQGRQTATTAEDWLDALDVINDPAYTGESLRRIVEEESAEDFLMSQRPPFAEQVGAVAQTLGYAYVATDPGKSAWQKVVHTGPSTLLRIRVIPSQKNQTLGIEAVTFYEYNPDRILSSKSGSIEFSGLEKTLKVQLLKTLKSLEASLA